MADSDRTSRSREESMDESGQDAFSDKGTSNQGETSKQGDGDSGKQTSSSSGTTPLTGETKDEDSRVSSGGVEGVRDNS